MAPAEWRFRGGWRQRLGVRPLEASTRKRVSALPLEKLAEDLVDVSGMADLRGRLARNAMR